MRSLLPIVAILGIAGAPAVAQTAPAESATAAKPKMVKKRVCEPVAAERVTGSRLGSTTKLCKTIVVPAESETGKKSENGKTSERTQAHGHDAHTN